MTKTVDVDVLKELGINTSPISKFLIREAKIRKFPINDFTDEKIKNALLAGIEADFEEMQSNDTRTRATFIRKNDSGVNIRVKNVWINRKAMLDVLLDGCEAFISLSPIALIRALKSVFEALQISLSSDEIFVFWNIYQHSKKEPVTDENLIAIINKAITNDSYDSLSEKEIKEIMDRLLQTKMITRKDGNYSITEKIVVKWL